MPQNRQGTKELAKIFPKSYLFSDNGTSFYFKEDENIGIDYLNAPVSDGIEILKGNSYPYTATVSTRFGNFLENTDDSEDFYIFVKLYQQENRLKHSIV